MNATNDRRIDYIEFPATDLEKTKLFYYTVFGWKFEDWGPDYASFHDGRLSGGFRKEKKVKGNGTATGTNPPGGTVVNRNTQITVDYKSEHCN